MCDGEPLGNLRLDGEFVGCADAEDDLFAASPQGHTRAIRRVAHELVVIDVNLRCDLRRPIIFAGELRSGGQNAPFGAVRHIDIIVPESDLSRKIVRSVLIVNNLRARAEEELKELRK